VTVRAFLCNAVLVISIVAWGTLCLPLLAAPRRVVAGVVHYWARSFLWAMRVIGGLDVAIDGRETLPDGPFVLAAKHQSAWDTFIFLALFRDSAYVLKRELLKIPFYGWYTGASGHIPVDRAAGASALKKMVAAAKRAAAHGRPIVIFPQGTRVAPGERRPYLPGVTALYAGLGLPVVPVALNSGLFWARKGLMLRSGTVSLRFGAPIQPGLEKRAFRQRLAHEIEGMSDALPGNQGTNEEQN